VADQVHLLLEVDEVKHCLDGVGALLVAANLHEPCLDGSQDCQSLLAGAGLEQLLAEVVSIVVYH
jgi:hypothetical protein